MNTNVWRVHILRPKLTQWTYRWTTGTCILMQWIIITSIRWITVMSLWALNGCRRALRAVIPFRARQLCFGLVAEITSQTNSRCSSSRWAESAIWTLITIETTIGEWTKAASRAEMALRYVPSSGTITEGSIGTRYWAVCGIRAVLTDWAWRCGVISESWEKKNYNQNAISKYTLR